jgi:hypothetical protein
MPALMPGKGGRYLSPGEVIARVKAAFPYFEATAEGTRAQVLECMSQLAFVAAQGRAAADDWYLDKLERLQNAALYLCFGDDPGDGGTMLGALMLPGQPICVEPLAQAHPERAHALIARCALALGYEIAQDRPSWR